MDRSEALLLYLLTVWGLWGAQFYSLLPNQGFASADGIRVLATATFLSVIASAVGGLVCLYWPQPHVILISDRERADFRSGIAAETYSILKKFIDPLNHLNIEHDSWSNKAPESRAAILGKNDYLVLQSFYDAIDERNKHFALRHGGFDPTELLPLNQTCVKTLSRAYSEVTWLKTESDTDILLSRARKSVGSPESAPLVMKVSDRISGLDRAARLDPVFAGVHALFFWPKQYSWQGGEREATINMPYTKVIITGKEAFWWGAYAEELFRKGKIEWNNAPGDYENENDMERYLSENGFNLHKWQVSSKDLLESASQ